MKIQTRLRLINPGIIKLVCNADKNDEYRMLVSIGDLKDWFDEYLKDPTAYVLR